MAQWTEYYQDGNTVRVREIPHRREEGRRREEERRRVEKVKKAHVKEQNQPEIASIPWPTLFVLLSVTLITLYLLFGYLSLKSTLDSKRENVAALETRLDRLKTENDAFEQSIDISVDLNYVYKVAVQKLGMVHAGAENVIRYDKTESQYVRQYEQIPEY